MNMELEEMKELNESMQKMTRYMIYAMVCLAFALGVSIIGEYL